MLLSQIVAYCNDYLRVAQVSDAPEALNGLQLENAGTVTKLAAAVDLNLSTVRLARDAGADLLLVHHGLFWSGLRPYTGPAYARIRELIQGGIALYSAHLPLDIHPEVGNAAILAKELGVSVRGEFAIWHDQNCGLWGEMDTTRAEFAARLGRILGRPVKEMAFGPDRVRKVGIATGGGGSMIGQAAALGLDTYVTGEGAHYTYFDAEELALNVYFGGHYATETFGVQALARHLSDKFGLPWSFLDHPTGL